MMRTVARTRAFPVLAWAYLAALAVQVFFAGMYVFVGASNIELHRNMAHVIGALTVLLIAATFVGRVPEKRMVLTVLGLLVVQGMLVHVGQWFGLWTIAALHPVNALVLTYASLESRQAIQRLLEGARDRHRCGSDARRAGDPAGRGLIRHPTPPTAPSGAARPALGS